MSEQFETLMLEVLNENKDRVKAAVTDNLIQKISEIYKWQMPSCVTEEINRFIENDVLPDVRLALAGSRDLIVEQATISASGIALEVGKAIQAKIAKNLGDSWKMSKIMEEVLK